jgi:hypothetical protein
MAGNRKPIPDASTEPGTTELDGQDNTIPEQEAQASMDPLSQDSTTTNPSIRNKTL